MHLTNMNNDIFFVKKHFCFVSQSCNVCCYCRKKQVEGDVICDALNTCCLRWLPDCCDKFECDCDKYRLLIESVICLLTTDKGVHL